MKVLYIGSSDRFAMSIISRFSKEEILVHVLGDEDFAKETKPKLPYKFYKCTLNSNKLRDAVKNINPDIVVYSNQIYTNKIYIDNDYANRYLYDTLCVLNVAKEFGIKKFIMISSDEVYCENIVGITEEVAVNPKSLRGIICRQAEDLCLQFNALYQLNILIYRIGPLYGYGIDETAGDLMALAIKSSSDMDFTKYPWLNVKSKRSIIHVNDVSDAILRGLSFTPKSIYNLSGNEGLSFADIVNIINNKSKDVLEDDLGSDKKLILDCKSIKNDLEWVPLYDIKRGIDSSYGIYENASRDKSIKKASKVKRLLEYRNTYQALLSVENVIMFLFAAILTLTFDNHHLFGNIDFMFIYILSISLLNGTKQSILSVVLASSLYIYRHLSEGASLISVVIKIDSILMLAQYLVIGVLVGYSVEHLRNMISQKQNEIEYLASEYEELKEINLDNIRIKHEYEKRLIDYKDSLPRLYTIVNKLDSLNIEKVFPSAIKVVQETMGVENVAIYLATPKSSHLRLVVTSNKDAAFGGKSLNLGVNQKMNSKLLQGELFLGDYWNGEPSMAMPVLNKGHLAAVIILNKIPFEKQTLYYSNLFRTVVALISIAILRAYDFERITRGQNYIDGTEILKPKAFMELLNIKDEAFNAKLSEYTLVHIKKDRLSAKEIYDVVGSKLRETDYLGSDTSGELYVLLSNTSRDEASVAINRLENLGVEAKVSGDLICQVS